MTTARLTVNTENFCWTLPTIDSFNTIAKDVTITVDDHSASQMANVVKSLSAVNGSWAEHVPPHILAAGEAVDYLAMLVAIDYRHWGVAEGTSLVVGQPVQKKDFYAVIPSGVGKVRGSQAMVEMLKFAASETKITEKESSSSSSSSNTSSQPQLWYRPEWLLRPENKENLRTILTGEDIDGTSSMIIPDFEGRYAILYEIAQYMTEHKTSFKDIFEGCKGKIHGPDGALAALMKVHKRFHDFSPFGAEGSSTSQSSSTASSSSSSGSPSSAFLSLNTHPVVPLLKLPQLTIIAVASAAPNLFLATELERLTVCPDYQVPKALIAVGALKYSDRLAELLERKILLGRDSAEEVEIRLGSVLAAERLRALLGLSAGEIDFALWKCGRECATLPHHLCETIMY